MGGGASTGRKVHTYKQFNIVPVSNIITTTNDNKLIIMVMMIKMAMIMKLR